MLLRLFELFLQETELDRIMKILYGITSATWGGAQENVYQLIKYQAKLKNNIILVVGNRGPLTSRVKRDFPNVKIYILNDLVREINPVRDTIALIKFKNIIKRELPNLVHLHSSKAGTIGRLASINCKSKIIYTIHGWPFTEGVESRTKKIVFRVIEKLLAPFTDEYICVSEFDKNLGLKYKILNQKKGNFITVHNAVNSVYSNSSDLQSVHKLPLKFTMVARFSKQKDQQGLIRTFKEVPNQNYILNFVGSGILLNNCKNLVEKLNLNSNIIFKGFQNNVTPFLMDSDVFILTSHYEGLPYSIIEAMSFGLPIIASDVGGNSELVKNGVNGFLVNNHDELKKAITTFINKPEIISKMGLESLKLFNKNFKLENQLKKVNGIYCRMLERKQQ